MPIWLIGLLIYLSSILFGFIVLLKSMWYKAKYRQHDGVSIDGFYINIFWVIFVPVMNIVVPVADLIENHTDYASAYPDNDIISNIEKIIRRVLNYLSGVQKIIDDDKVAKL